MEKRILTVSGKFVNHDGIFIGTIFINTRTGIIENVSPLVHKDADIFVPDKLIFPGMIDLHVHGREDESGEDSYKEDFETLGEAAIDGGVVCVGEMPNNPIPPTTKEIYARKKKLAEKSRVPVLLYAAAGPGTRPFGKKQPYKFYIARSTGKNDIIFFKSNQAVRETVCFYLGVDGSYHCEDQEILDAHKGETLHELRRPPEAELSALDLALEMIEITGQRGKLCHCSVVSGLEKIMKAKERGVDVVCEVCPHHLYFDTSMITDENRPYLQMNPPLRSEKDRLGMIEALRKGEIDMLVTDHAPHTVEDKMKGASGLPLLDTYGPFTTWLMAEQKFLPTDIARICCFNPGNFINRFGKIGEGYGMIAEGYVGSLTIIDLKTPTRVEKSSLKTKCGWSPFEGVTFPGSVSHTIVLGKVLKKPQKG